MLTSAPLNIQVVSTTNLDQLIHSGAGAPLALSTGAAVHGNSSGAVAIGTIATTASRGGIASVSYGTDTFGPRRLGAGIRVTQRQSRHHRSVPKVVVRLGS